MTTKTKKPTKPKCRLSDERVIAEEYEEAKLRSMRIRRPTDIRPVRWSCNPDKRWIHLTEDEWIALCDAFTALEEELRLKQEIKAAVPEGVNTLYDAIAELKHDAAWAGDIVRAAWPTLTAHQRHVVTRNVDVDIAHWDEAKKLRGEVYDAVGWHILQQWMWGQK